MDFKHLENLKIDIYRLKLSFCLYGTRSQWISSNRKLSRV